MKGKTKQQIVIGIIYDPYKKVLAMIERKGNPSIVEFPGGKQETGETKIEALIRELREETGFTCSDFQWLKPYINKNKKIEAAFCLIDKKISNSETPVYWVDNPIELTNNGYSLQECVNYFYEQVKVIKDNYKKILTTN